MRYFLPVFACDATWTELGFIGARFVLAVWGSLVFAVLALPRTYLCWGILWGHGAGFRSHHMDAHKHSSK